MSGHRFAISVGVVGTLFPTLVSTRAHVFFPQPGYSADPRCEHTFLIQNGPTETPFRSWEARMSLAQINYSSHRRVATLNTRPCNEARFSSRFYLEPVSSKYKHPLP